MERRLDPYVLKGDLQHRLTFGPLTLGGNAHSVGIDGWQVTHQGFEMLRIEHGFCLPFGFLHITILGHSQHKIVSEIFTRLPKGVHIAAAISHVDPLVVLRDPSDLLDAVLPNLRFSLSLLAL